MASRTIRLYGDPVLRLKAKQVTDFGDHWLELIDDMYDTCDSDEGAGLAAPQIGLSIQLAVIYLRQADEEPFRLAVFNPELFDPEGDEQFEEGCLSIPGIRENVNRPGKIKLRYQDYLGEEHVIQAGGLLARVLQHEIDHLNGVLFVDHISSVRRLMLKNKLKIIANGEYVEEEDEQRF